MLVRTPSEIYCANEDGTKHGRYNQTDDTGKLTVSGAHAAGKPDGTWNRHGAQGDVIDSYEIRDGTGTVKSWRRDGSVETETTIVAGVKHGPFVRWSSDGKAKLEQGEYDRGHRARTWVYRDKRNELQLEIDFRAAVMWETRHFEDGKLTRTELSKVAREELASAFNPPATDSLAARAELINKFSGIGSGKASKAPGGSGEGTRVLDVDRSGSRAITGVSGAHEARRRGHVQLGKETIDGDLDSGWLRRMIEGRLFLFTACYERELEKSPVLEGKLTVLLRISSTGKVVSFSAHGFSDEWVESCFANALSALKFPRPKSGTVAVRLPFHLSPATK